MELAHPRARSPAAGHHHHHHEQSHHAPPAPQSPSSSSSLAASASSPRWPFRSLSRSLSTLSWKAWRSGSFATASDSFSSAAADDELG